jgi:thioredoxin-related protein
MRKAVFILLFSMFILNLQAQKVGSADEVLKLAKQQAVKKKKNVIVIFHASWCVWCRKMDASLNDPAIKKFFEDNYVITHLVVQESKEKKQLENPGGEACLEKMGGKEQGLPYWIVLDAKGNKLADSRMSNGDNTGCPAKEEEVQYFTTVLKKTSKLTDSEIEQIGKRFRKND